MPGCFLRAEKMQTIFACLGNFMMHSGGNFFKDQARQPVWFAERFQSTECKSGAGELASVSESTQPF